MKIVISEEQFNKLYSVPDRPSLTEVEYVVNILQEEEDEDDIFDLGMSGETNEHHLYYFYIGEAFFDEFYDKTYLELFDEYKQNPEDCTPFVDAVIKSIIEKMKQSIEEKKAAKILKKVIKKQIVVKFKESDILKILDAHFGNFICSEFLEEAR
jgi:DNA replicative helicase MCM subunit Mcm2 (Cdc46/Mcm family)